MADLPTNWVDNVGMVENAAFLNLVGTNVNANTAARPVSGVYSSLPTAGISGRLYYATDAGIVLRDNGSSWNVVGGDGCPVFTLPPTTGWTTVGASGSFSADKGGRVLSRPSTSGDSLTVEYRTLSPTSNYTLTAYIEASLNPKDNGQRSGIGLRESSSGKVITWGPGVITGTGFRVCEWSSLTGTSDVSSVSLSDSGVFHPIRWWRIRDNGTSRFFEFSYNGLDWIIAYTTTRTNFITADQVCWGASWNGGSKPNPDLHRLRSLSVV